MESWGQHHTVGIPLTKPAQCNTDSEPGLQHLQAQARQDDGRAQGHIDDGADGGHAGPRRPAPSLEGLHSVVLHAPGGVCEAIPARPARLAGISMALHCRLGAQNSSCSKLGGVSV